MATENTRPTTFHGIKRLAKFIKEARDIPHHDALDAAAKKAGFQNLRHAHAVLMKSANDLHRAFVTFYWVERKRTARSLDGPVVRSGRTTYEFLLPIPLADLLPGKSLYRTPYLEGYRLEAPDHLERQGDHHDEIEGLRTAMKAALALNFMAVTGLRAPLARESDGPRLTLSKNADHYCRWYDEESKSIVVLDEPYRKLYEDETAWADAHGFHTVAVPWRGIYMAGVTPRLHGSSELVLSRLVEKLETLEARLKVERWAFNTQAYESQFISPARVHSGKRKPPRAMPTPQTVERAGAVPWGPGSPGHRSMWRPARRMDLDKHLLIGPILTSLSFSVVWDWTGARIGQIRNILDGWFYFEYADSELPSKKLRRVYDLPKPTAIDGKANQLEALALVRQTIVEGYQDCKPKYELLERIDRSERWIRLNLEEKEVMRAS